MAFIETRITREVLYASTFSEGYAVDSNTTRAGRRYARLVHPYPTWQFDISLRKLTSELLTEIFELYHRSGGQFGGFRARHPVDYSTNDFQGVPTAFDQQCVYIGNEDSPNTDSYQITRWYDTQGAAASTRRRILKPEAGTVLAGIINTNVSPNTQSAYAASQLSIDTTTGVISVISNAKAVTGITQAAQAVITVGASHGYIATESIQLSGVTGMTEINGVRGNVVSVGGTTITTDIDTSAFSAYVSGGTVNTVPQSGEVVTAGCYFDLPVFFSTELTGSLQEVDALNLSLTITELLNL